MSADHVDAILASGPLIEELVSLAQASSVAPKLHVIALAGAMAQAALEGDVPDSYVLDAVGLALAAAKAPDPTTH